MIRCILEKEYKTDENTTAYGQQLLMNYLLTYKAMRNSGRPTDSDNRSLYRLYEYYGYRESTYAY